MARLNGNIRKAIQRRFEHGYLTYTDSQGRIYKVVEREDGLHVYYIGRDCCNGNYDWWCDPEDMGQLY